MMSNLDSIKANYNSYNSSKIKANLQFFKILVLVNKKSFPKVSPKNKILKFLYKIHLKHVVPVCGKILLGNPEEYKMLWKYTEAYKNSELAKQIFEEAGLHVNYESYFGGCATGISGKKT